MTNTELIVLTHTIRRHIENGELEKVVEIVWREMRDRYEEDNIPSSTATIIEIIEELSSCE